MSDNPSKIRVEVKNDVSRSCIYLIDDDPITNFINKKMIQKHYAGLSVRDFESAIDAIEVLESHQNTWPDLILLDLNMPIMNGWDLLDYLSERDINIPVIILTSSFNQKDREKSTRYDKVIGFMTKPLSLVELFELVHVS